MCYQMTSTNLNFFFSPKGDFVGRAALQELLKYRSRRHLVQVKIDSPEVDPHVSRK